MREHWPQLGAGAIIIRHNQVLLVRRGREPGRGLWAIPGGKVEPGETMRAAAEREVLEETGIRIAAGELIWHFEFIQHDDEGALRFHYVVFDFLGHYLGGEPLAGDDADAVAWAPLDQLLTWRLHPNTREALLALTAKQKGE